MPSSRSYLYVFLLILGFQSIIMAMANNVPPPPQCRPVVASTFERIEFIVNLMTLNTELCLRGSIGVGINGVSPGLVRGPVPIGATMANLDNVTRKILEEIGLNGVGHLRAIVNNTAFNAPIPLPQIDLSEQVYSMFINAALNVTLTPPLNIYNSTPIFLTAATFTSSILQQYYAQIIPSIVGTTERQLMARIALSTSTGFGALRSRLNDMVNLTVTPYTFTVGDFINNVARLFNQVAGCGVKDEGLIVPLQLGAENRTTSNVVPADVNSLAFARTELEILRFLQGTGNASKPGGFFPSGVNGTLSRRIVRQNLS